MKPNDTTAIKVKAREVFMPSPGPGSAIFASAYAASASPPILVCHHALSSRSDTVDVSFRRFSTDNGRTWSKPEERPTKFNAASGTGRRHPRGGFLDPHTGRFIEFWTEGVLPTDDPLEGMRQWGLMHSISRDGGHTSIASGPIIQDEPGYDEAHPFPGVHRGRTCIMIGDFSCRPIALADGVILLPVQASPAGPDGFYHKPAGALTFTDALVLRGIWKEEGRISWQASSRVSCPPSVSTRGMIEPTIAELDNGRILMVLRGSNDAAQTIPGYRWRSFSDDRGLTWSEPKPWRFTDDSEPFFSPSSCSQLIPHSSGRVFWAGNICKENPRCNSPRYPFVMAEVDQATGLLLRETLTIIDDLQPGENPRMTLSNFLVREDVESPDLLLHITRLFSRPDHPDGNLDWTADALLYRIQTTKGKGQA